VQNRPANIKKVLMDVYFPINKNQVSSTLKIMMPAEVGSG
jgi:hypothetical protein